MSPIGGTFSHATERGLQTVKVFPDQGSDAAVTPLKPILKWAGGKRQVLPFIRPLVPGTMNKFIEPFLGGGAVLFDLAPKKAIVNDLNSELINLYVTIRDEPLKLISRLKRMTSDSEEYYKIRAWDRDSDKFEQRSNVEKAARTIYLNRTGYNGLYRVNSKNQHNVPFGKYVNPKICDSELIIAMSDFFSKNRIVFKNEDFRKTIARSGFNDFIYVDPPYAPLDEASSTFTSYTSDGFSLNDLADLKTCLDEASERGSNWLMSNVKSNATSKLFPRSKYRVVEVSITRPINSKVSGRGGVTEILVSPK